MASRQADRQEQDEQARKYIDEIAAINKRHGMGPVREDRYNRAVKDTARVFEGLRSSEPR
jgi:hypothetical protein